MQEVKSINEAIKVMSVHMANLFYYLTKEVLADFGDPAKESFKRAIVEFGRARGQAIREKVLADGLPLTLENLDKYYDIPLDQGWQTQREYKDNVRNNVTDNCTQALIWKEKNWEEVGHIYCLVDFAIREGFSDNVEFQAIKNILLGDDYCQSRTVYKNLSNKGL